MNVSVILACYNRKETTRQCIEALNKQLCEEKNLRFDIYVYDDASTDGTYDMLVREWPSVKVIRGSGASYWAKSMHDLMQIVKNKYDYYLMVNDDVIFRENAVKTIFRAYKQADCNCGIVGATQSFYSGEITYGGRDKEKKLINPSREKLLRCQWAGWNCFLINNEVLNLVGIIDGKYQHAWGDWDYSYRMSKKKIPIYLASDYIGYCEENTINGTYMDDTLSIKMRLKNLFSSKGLPFYSYIRYNVKTRGLLGFIIAIYGYTSLIYYIISKKNMVKVEK